jgi:S-DNA-T family DNA segregation ATPase FtsK/SpoIIIE
MLYFPTGASKPVRVQGAYVSDKEVGRVTAFLKAQNALGYDKDTAEAIGAVTSSIGSNDDNSDEDELLPQAVTIVVEAGYASVSLIQRRMNVGYPRAARLIDHMQEKGFVGPFEGSKPRKVLISLSQWLEYKAKEGF